MMLAVQRVQIATYDVDTQLRPSIATLKAANVDLPDIWHLISKQPFILSQPDVLQRWLDFLAVYGLKSKDLFNFCLRTTQSQFLHSTVHQAGMAIAYLRKLGIKDEFLATRLIGLWPEVLAKDVEAQVVPLVQYLMSLGMEIPDVTNVIMEWPEILSCDVASHLEPLAAYLQSLGCGPLQIAQVVQACPHLARFEPRAAFESKLQPLRRVGLTDGDIRSMVQVHAGFLAASGGPAQQLDALGAMGLGKEGARALLVARPQVLLEKPAELLRKHAFLVEVLKCDLGALAKHPQYLCHSLMHTIGPRYYFAAKKGGLGEFQQLDGELDLTRLVALPDVEFTELLGAPWNEYDGFRFKWQKDYTQKINLESELNLREELARVFREPGQQVAGDAGGGASS